MLNATERFTVCFLAENGNEGAAKGRQACRAVIKKQVLESVLRGRCWQVPTASSSEWTSLTRARATARRRSEPIDTNITASRATTHPQGAGVSGESPTTWAQSRRGSERNAVYRRIRYVRVVSLVLQTEVHDLKSTSAASTVQPLKKDIAGRTDCAEYRPVRSVAR